MWIFTVHGFFSVVCPNNRPLDGSDLDGKLTVDTSKVSIRARSRSHLESLMDAHKELTGPILMTPGRDYACRIIVDKDAWVSVACALSESIDYHNFKDRVGSKDEVYHRLLSRVWNEGYSAQKSWGMDDTTGSLQEIASRSNEIKEMLDKLAALPVDDYLSLLRGRSPRDLSGVEWRSLVARGFAVRKGIGISTHYVLTAKGREAMLDD